MIWGSIVMKYRVVLYPGMHKEASAYFYRQADAVRWYRRVLGNSYVRYQIRASGAWVTVLPPTPSEIR